LTEQDVFDIIKKYPCKHILIPHEYLVTKVDTTYYKMSLYDCYDTDLFEQILHLTEFSQNEVLYIFRIIAECVNHLHKLNIIIGDVKPENVLLKQLSDKTYDVKLCDFETCIDMNKNPTPYINIKFHRGTVVYYPPECVFHNKFSLKMDVWALGQILYMLLTGNRASDDQMLIRKRKQYSDSVYSMCIVDDKIKKLDRNAYKLLCEMLNLHVDHRINMSTVMSSDYLAHF
jgi:serine/threonine protein kinase